LRWRVADLIHFEEGRVSNVQICPICGMHAQMTRTSGYVQGDIVTYEYGAFCLDMTNPKTPDKEF
jgi:hypothetical protein